MLEKENQNSYLITSGAGTLRKKKKTFMRTWKHKNVSAGNTVRSPVE